jgi:two-component system, NtrC family, sensor histidine kinase GlrK
MIKNMSMQIAAKLSLGGKIKDLNRTITIRQKLLIGSSLIIISVLIISLYAIIQLRQLDTLITTAVTIDAKILRGSENLKSFLLVQMGHERKFIITGDDDFKQLFNENTRDFQATQTAMETIAENEEVRGLIARVKKAYGNYLNLAISGFLQHDHGTEAAHQLRQKVEAELNDSLDDLYDMAQQVLTRKMLRSQEISSGGTRLAVLISFITALLGMLFALLIARSIYMPLRRLKEATHFISRGDFSKKIDIARQDEIGELSDSFNMMCDRLLELDRLKSDFISNITHDLKTPLASITEANQLMLDGAAGETTAQQQRLLGIIREDSARLTRLISSVIDLAKMESGILNYDLLPADICLLTLEAVESVRFLASSKKIAIAFQPDRSLPQLLIDDDKMRQALINLLSNAIKFTPAGGTVTVSIARTDQHPAEFASRQAVMISITDTGVGIVDADLPRIFEKFFRGSAGSVGKGSGLGLTIAHHIVQAHGGLIWAASMPGSGSTFYVLLPIDHKDVPAPDAAMLARSDLEQYFTRRMK